MKCYCPKCDKMSEVTVHTMEETFVVKGEKIVIDSEVAICNECESKVFHQELDDRNLRLAYSIHRKKHNLLSPSEIQRIREKYLLSQRALGRLLEWGEITINRYENGAIQDPAHNEVLTFIADPKNMKEIFEKNNQFLSPRIREKLDNTISRLIKDELKPQFRISLEDHISARKSIDEYSGFTIFELDKMISMILYIVERTEHAFATKLNKLLWYSDFVHFKEYGKSISGSGYIHLPLGPVPDHYDLIIDVAKEEDLLNEEEIAFSSGITGTQYRPAASVEKSRFNVQERKTMDYITDYFSSYTSQEIKDKSHNERAYQETELRQKISYKYAQFISLD